MAAAAAAIRNNEQKMRRQRDPPPPRLRRGRRLNGNAGLFEFVSIELPVRLDCWLLVNGRGNHPLNESANRCQTFSGRFYICR